MKYILTTICLWLCLSQILAQEANKDKSVSINVVEPIGETITDEAAKYFVSKMQRLIATNGLVDNGFNERFVLTARVNTISRDITQTAPVRISQKLEIIFFIGDVQENKLYSSTSLMVSGIGTSETKSLMSAFQRISSQNEKLQTFIEEGKNKIVDYYSSNCDDIIAHAKSLASKQQYEEAIHTLILVPDVCSECFQRCQKAMEPIYKQMIDVNGLSLLTKAKAIWSNNPTNNGAEQAFQLTSQINTKASCFKEVQIFHNTIAQKLSDDEKQRWEFEMKKYEDSQAFKRTILEVCKAIGVAWGSNQPKSVVKNIIRRW